MPKKSKKESASETSEAKNAAAETPSSATPAKPARKRSASARKPAARKKTASAKAPKTPREKKLEPAGPAPTEPSDSDIRIRAYFIAERRARLSLGGDPANDWIEARRQLLEESEQRQR